VKNLQFLIGGVGKKAHQQVSASFLRPGVTLQRVAIFSIYYAFHESNLRVIKFLNDSRYSVVLVANRNLSESEIAEYAPYVVAVIVRPNVGYDFGAYKTGASYVSKFIQPNTDLVLVNDSVYFLPETIPLLKEVLESRFDVSGVTANRNKYHLQSYFIRFNGEGGATTIAFEFLEKFRTRHGKVRAIKRGEIELSRVLMRKNMKLGEVVTPVKACQSIAGYMQQFERGTSTKDTGPHELDSLRNDDMKLISEVFNSRSGIHYFGVSLALRLGVPIKLDLNEVHDSLQIVTSLASSKLGEELTPLIEWFSRRSRRGLAEHGLQRSFAIRNLR